MTFSEPSPAASESPQVPLIVAIDGPAGSGKSSVSKAVARRLGYGFLDTGAAYRAFAWFALERGVDTSEAEAVTATLPYFDYTIGTDPDGYAVLVGDTDVTEAIRDPRISATVSAVARVPEVRAFLTALFRSIAREQPLPGIVVEGRDITTVVEPEAEVRILLTASEEARMARRSLEISTQSAETVAEQLRSRDAADSKVVEFMSAADGVTTVDSTHLDFEQTIDAVIDVITTRTARNSHD
ncbi:(d)CMP kinase [Glaciibacter psychrotolerans]|uniref:Cytidylate kinase n=1 Tax=Glaciibacter psychrotolerans TaxID=670054 RepID=A0A7Z0ECM2_9MICO|nr:(d)CMP kinase [Leifsonia psychrotolerans]NYJ18467.1 cytidylate kinase [Leifsonia psychrotolerans]